MMIRKWEKDIAFLRTQTVSLFSLFFFLLWFLLCCFAVCAGFLLSFLCPTFVFSLRKFLPDALRFPCAIFVFIDLFICEINVLLCVRLQVCLWGFPLLALVCPFPFPPFASFACFYKALKASIYAPCVLPSTPRPSVSPDLL